MRSWRKAWSSSEQFVGLSGAERQGSGLGAI